MAGNNLDLNEADMWDDSALVESWNEALAEYKKYHSVHAKGGSIQELKALAKSREDTKRKKEEEEENATENESVAMEVEDSPAAEDAATNSQEATKSAPPLAPPITALGTVGDENLKKLLMSWYYAGYYTGLYEGQQQQQQQQQPQS